MSVATDYTGLKQVGNHWVNEDDKRPIYAVADADLELKGSFHGLPAMKSLYLMGLKANRKALRRLPPELSFDLVNLPRWLARAAETLAPSLDDSREFMIRLVEATPLGATFETPRHHFPIELLEMTRALFKTLEFIDPVKRKAAAAFRACNDLLADLGSDGADVPGMLEGMTRSARRLVDVTEDGGPGYRHGQAAEWIVKSLEASVREKLGDDQGEDADVVADTLEALLKAHSFVAYDDARGYVLRRLAAKRYADELISWIEQGSDVQSIWA
jgi:hypothetical protein